MLQDLGKTKSSRHKSKLAVGASDVAESRKSERSTTFESNFSDDNQKPPDTRDSTGEVANRFEFNLVWWYGSL